MAPDASVSVLDSFLALDFLSMSDPLREQIQSTWHSKHIPMPVAVPGRLWSKPWTPSPDYCDGLLTFCLQPLCPVLLTLCCVTNCPKLRTTNIYYPTVSARQESKFASPGAWGQGLPQVAVRLQSHLMAQRWEFAPRLTCRVAGHIQVPQLEGQRACSLPAGARGHPQLHGRGFPSAWVSKRRKSPGRKPSLHSLVSGVAWQVFSLWIVSQWIQPTLKERERITQRNEQQEMGCQLTNKYTLQSHYS